MARPTSPHSKVYRTGPAEGPADGRLASPVFARNAPPIIARLARLFGDATGPVLEIGAGTGQHAAAFALAFPGLRWVPSDPDPLHRASIVSWAREWRAPEIAPLDLDASTDWAVTPQVAALGPLTGIVALNVIHIAPPAVADGILRGAGRALAPGGRLIFYGPFRVDGAHTGPGNVRFDAGLRAENPDWGIRDAGEIARTGAGHGLEMETLIEMPADNRLLVLRRPG